MQTTRPNPFTNRQPLAGTTRDIFLCASAKPSITPPIARPPLAPRRHSTKPSFAKSQRPNRALRSSTAGSRK